MYVCMDECIHKSMYVDAAICECLLCRSIRHCYIYECVDVCMYSCMDGCINKSMYVDDAICECLLCWIDTYMNV